MVVSVAETLGAGTTVTFIESVILAQGAFAFPVRANLTTPDFMLGVYMVTNDEVVLNEPEPALHKTDAVFEAVAVLIVIEETVEQMVVSVTVICGGVITVTVAVADTLAQGAYPFAVNVKVTVPDEMVGV